MIKINLISPADKLSIKWEKTNHSVIFNYAVIVFVQVFFVVILLAAAGYLNMENGKLNKQLDNMKLKSEVREINLIDEEVAKYNNQLSAILGMQEGQFQWTKILGDFSRVVSSGIKINNISIESKKVEILKKDKTKEISSQDNAGDFKLVITGTSRTLEDLLNFEENLKNSEIFIDFNIEPKNYDGENFSYVLSIKRDDVVSN